MFLENFLDTLSRVENPVTGYPNIQRIPDRFPVDIPIFLWISNGFPVDRIWISSGHMADFWQISGGFQDTGCSENIVFFHNLLEPLPRLHRCKRISISQRNVRVQSLLLAGNIFYNQ